jgi:hypothetical protein
VDCPALVPRTVAANESEPPGVVEPALGATVTVIACGVTETVAVAFLDVSATLVAVT